MRKGLLFLIFCLLFVLLANSGRRYLTAAPSLPQGAAAVDPVFPGMGIITSRSMTDGRISTAYLSVFGPNTCVDYGDPYSPLNSPYASGLYTYLFRIRIQADYPASVVRVELLDPDSINQASNNFTVSRSNTAVTNGLAPLASKSCDFGQKDPCLLETDELNLVSGPPNLAFDAVNPY